MFFIAYKDFLYINQIAYGSLRSNSQHCYAHFRPPLFGRKGGGMVSGGASHPGVGQRIQLFFRHHQRGEGCIGNWNQRDHLRVVGSTGCPHPIACQFHLGFCHRFFGGRFSGLLGASLVARNQFFVEPPHHSPQQ